MSRDIIRTWTQEGFSLVMYDTGTYDRRGCTRIGYTLCDSAWPEDPLGPAGADVPILEGDDFCGSPLHADDSDDTVAGILTFLSLRPGDVERDYFDEYSERAMAWVSHRAEYLSLLAYELRERADEGWGSSEDDDEEDWTQEDEERLEEEDRARRGAAMAPDHGEEDRA